VVHSSP